MAADLHHIFAGIRMRRHEYAGQHLVDYAILLIADAPEMDGMAVLGVQVLAMENPGGHADGVRPRQADHAQGACSGRGGQGDDGVG